MCCAGRVAGISLPSRNNAKVTQLLRVITNGWVKWHVFVDDLLQKLRTVKVKWLPSNTADTPETMFGAIMRALLSRKIKPNPLELGVDMEGIPAEPRPGDDPDNE